MPAPTPRVRPRVPIEDLVDRKTHPPRRPLARADQEEAPRRLHWTERVGLVLLGVFWASVPLAGLLGPILGLSAGLGLLGLAASSLTASILLAAE